MMMMMMIVTRRVRGVELAWGTERGICPSQKSAPTEYCLPENDYRGRLSLVTVGIQSYRWVWGLELLLALGVELLWLGVRIRVRS